MHRVKLPSGQEMPALGLGTWHMGERADQRRAETDALRHGLDQGVRLIDTAEMYGDGGAEKVVGEAVRGHRDDVVIVSKVYPHNATRDGVASACERSLRRLQTDRIDVYLLHWRGGVPLAETFEAFERLRDAGKIRDYGVSNFDRDDLDDVGNLDDAVPGTNQILYNLARREAEWAVLPWCRERSIPVMAYCPLDQGGRLLRDATLGAIAKRHSATPAQVALAWLLQQDMVVAIPKSSRPERIRENFAAAKLDLSGEDISELEHAYPGPIRPARLGMV